MLRVIVLPNPRLAQSFLDYMSTQGVMLTLRILPDSDPQQAELWLDDESALPKVQEALTPFLHDPLHTRYQAASWQSGKTDTQMAYPDYSYWYRLRSQAGPLTLSVMMLTIVIYLLMQIVGDEQVMVWLAWPQDNSQDFQLWRWVSHALLHFSLLHVTFNLMWWWYLGGPLEQQLGSGKLFVITLVSALFSGWGQSLFSGPYFGGLSGVVYALMGYVWLTGVRAPERGLSLPSGLMVFSLIWLVAGYFNIFGLSIANTAHLAGLVMGLLMAFWDTRRSTRAGA